MRSARASEIRGTLLRSRQQGQHAHRRRVGTAVIAFGWAYAVLALGSAFTAGSPTKPASAAAPRQETAPAVKINEVVYDPPVAGAEADSEWIELYNSGGESVDLAGWTVEDNRAARALPPIVVPSGGFIVVAGGTGFRSQYPAYAGLLVELDGAIGNGLGNTGDVVKLMGPSGAEADAMSYGGDAAALDPPVALVETGHSVERVPPGMDTDSAVDWVDQEQPSPGEPATTPPTSTATIEPPFSPTPVEPPADTPRLNEFLPAPRVVDWNGDGAVDSGDEWVEIINRGDVEWNLSGWQLDDVAEGGSAPWIAPAATVVPPRGYLLLFASTTGLTLNNSGDELRLLSPDGGVVDAAAYGSTQPDVAIARDPDGIGPWSDSLAPSPGSANPPDSSATATSIAGTTATATVPVAATGSPPAPTVQPGMTPAVLLPMLISEVMYDGQGTNDVGAEWIEVHNPGAVAVTLRGWAVADGVARDALPDVTVPAGGFVLVTAGPTPGAALVADGRIGNGLANKGDVVRLLGPAGEEVDAVSFGANLDAFDPSVPLAPPGASVERVPAGLDSDSAQDWWSQDPPTPGLAGAVPEPVPRVVINEVLPSPRFRDWDGDGAAGFEDEWIELYNAGNLPIRLRDWSLRVGDGRWEAPIPDPVIEAAGFIVVWRRDSGLFLNEADALALVRRDGVIADVVSWDRSPGSDRVWGRSADGAADWTDGLTPTPGMSNRLIVDAGSVQNLPRPPTVLEVAPLSALRGVRAGARVAVRGNVLVKPGVMGKRVFYVGDATGGVRVQVSGEGAEADLTEGDVVRLIGRYGFSFGEPQLRVADRDVMMESSGTPPDPVVVRTGELATFVGRLVKVAGRVDGWQPSTVYVDDGSGSATVLFRAATGTKRPWVERAQWLYAVGIVGRFAREPEKPGGYRLIPRGPSDIAAPSVLPSRLPAAGRAARSRYIPSSSRSTASAVAYD